MIELDKNFRDYVVNLPRAKDARSVDSLFKAGAPFLMREDNRYSVGQKSGGDVNISNVEGVYVPKSRISLPFHLDEEGIFVGNLFSDEFTKKMVPQNFMHRLEHIVESILNERLLSNQPDYLAVIGELAMLKKVALMEIKDFPHYLTEAYLTESYKKK